MIDASDRKYIAKFSSQNDLYSVVKAEYIAMRLATEVGITAAPVALNRVAGKDVLLVERFDREMAIDGWRRKAVSALYPSGPWRNDGSICELRRPRHNHPSSFQYAEASAQRAICANALQRSMR